MKDLADCECKYLSNVFIIYHITQKILTHGYVLFNVHVEQRKQNNVRNSSRQVERSLC